MEIFKENVLTLRFNGDGDFGNEIKLIKSVFKKVETISSRPGFKRDFDPKEIELIRSLSATLNKEYDDVPKL